jgi:hypothetical protein
MRFNAPFRCFRRPCEARKVAGRRISNGLRLAAVTAFVIGSSSTTLRAEGSSSETVIGRTCHKNTASPQHQARQAYGSDGRRTL